VSILHGVLDIGSRIVAADSGVDGADRIARLERIVASAPPVVDPLTGTTPEAVTRHLAGIPLDRIRQLSEELEGPDHGDEIDALTIRLLLNDYIGAVARLRGVVRAAADRIDAAGSLVSEARGSVWREVKWRESGRYAVDTSDGPPPTNDEPTAEPLV
jgi:hypothetical protein